MKEHIDYLSTLFVGIDIASRIHVISALDFNQDFYIKMKPFENTKEGAGIVEKMIADVLADHHQFKYVVIAKYYSLYQIKRAYKLSSILPYFGVNDNLISPSSMGTYLLIALDHLFQKENFKESFSSIFYTFAKERNDYMHLDRRLEQNFLPNLFKLIEHYKPTSDSLGLLVKSHIDNDLTKSIYLLNNTVSSNAQQIAYKELIKQSSQYLAVLERNNHMF